MKYDFDSVTDRRGTNCLKYDFAVEKGMPGDILPLWIADMDFRTVPEVTKRLKAAVEHGIFGYSDGKEDYFRAVSDWYGKNFGWKTEPQWLVRVPGVVYAIHTAIQAYTRKGESVMIQTPVYHPFYRAIESNGRKLVKNPLKLENGHYEINFEDFEKKIRENRVKLFILCSPHNPVGRVWKEWELRRMGNICLKYGVLIVSDEIHSDFTYPGHTHTVFASLEPEYQAITVTCTAPSKTFNLAGLQASNLFIADETLRRSFCRIMEQEGYGEINMLGLFACQAAYEHGREWLEELKLYLKGNLDYVREYLKEKLPMVHLVEPEGTYLLWLDFRDLKLEHDKLQDTLINRCKLWLNDGAMFGEEENGFERMNIACPRKTLEQAMKQLEQGIKSL